ncbi:MAG: hypothetical protein MK171_00540 [Pirellulales bacterium]|nr:hypothetical protein [Pirellulales bacterium]
MNRETTRELTVFCLLLAIGVLGRWAQPDWNFTPLAAVTVLGAYYFRQLMPAILLPVGVLLISDLMVAAHNSYIVQSTVHLMMIVPLWMGRAMRRTEGLGSKAWRRAAAWAMCGIVPATAFYLVTNFAVWAARSDYPATASGLLACFTAGIPFYRTMIAGDIVYLTLLVGCLAVARAASRQSDRKVAARGMR